MRRSSLPLATLLLASLPWPAPALVQGLYLGGDATLASRYVWRGVTRVDGSVLQPEGYVGLQLDGGFLSAGVWSSYELSQAGPSGLSDLGPGRTGFGEVDYWSQYARAFGLVHASLGFLCYTYHGRAPGLSRTSAANTREVYGTIRLSSKYLAPKLAGYWDVGRVKELYLEASGTIPVMGNPLGEPFWAIYVQGLAGYSVGQEVNRSDPGEGANFARSGLTHADVSLAFAVTVPKVKLPIHFEGHLQFNRDDVTRRTSAAPEDADHRVKAWFGLSLSLSGPVLKW